MHLWGVKLDKKEYHLWSSLLVLTKIRHNLDMMHIEKNICDSILGSLINIQGKMKDVQMLTGFGRLDIIIDLHLIEVGDRVIIHHPYFMLYGNKRKYLCAWLRSVQFSDDL